MHEVWLAEKVVVAKRLLLPMSAIKEQNVYVGKQQLALRE